MKNNKELYEYFSEHPPDEICSRKILKLLGYSDKRLNACENPFDELLSIDGSNLFGLFVTLSYGLEPNLLLKLTNEECKQIVDDYITLKLNVDEKIIFSFPLNDSRFSEFFFKIS